MTCIRCGFPETLPGGYCQQCGQQQPTLPVQHVYLKPDRVQRHLHWLSVLWTASGIVYLLAVLVGMTVFKFFFFGRFGHMQVWNSHADRIPFIHVILPAVFLLISVLGFAAIVIGYGLNQRRSWARTTAMVFGCLALLKFPLGTALGIYTLWVLAPITSAAEYDSIAAMPSI
jgi:hypothetical protein